MTGAGLGCIQPASALPSRPVSQPRDQARRHRRAVQPTLPGRVQQSTQRARGGRHLAPTATRTLRAAIITASSVVSLM